MKILQRNTKSIYIAYYTGKQNVTSGTKTLKIDTWGSPIKISLNLSIPTGNIVEKLFGTMEMYELVGISTNTNLKIDEKTKVWVDLLPNSKLDNNDYLIKNIQRSLNQIAIGLNRKAINYSEIWLSNVLNGKPFEFRLNIEKQQDGTLEVIVKNTDNVVITSSTKIWFEQDYNVELNNNNYIFDSVVPYNGFSKYILTPIPEE